MFGQRGVHFGKTFEAQVSMQARIQNLLLVDHGSKVMHVGRGAAHRTIAQKCDLDFRLHRRDGAIAFVDCKSNAKAYMTFSEFTQHQIQRAVLYESFQCQAGMLVHLREKDEVVYFPGCMVMKYGSRKRFDSTLGLLLGSGRRFVLAPIFEARSILAGRENKAADA